MLSPASGHARNAATGCVGVASPACWPWRRDLLMTEKKKSVSTKVKASDIVVPDKLYFRIGEVARLCHLPAYVLRFWETEFPQLKPGKSGTGQRMYRRRDVENVLRIRKLLYEDGFTISGARQ